jgi:hypothetical protein
MNRYTLTLLTLTSWLVGASAAVLDQQAPLDAPTFWDNRDWAWHRKNIPFFECPDAGITTTYHYRWAAR